MDVFDVFMKQGYEGCMVRNVNGMYKYKRSYDLQKIKEFDDDEFKVVDVKVGTKGKMAGKAIFVFELPNDQTFDAKMKGSLDELEQYATNPELAIGRMVTVQYQGYTKYGKPRFPVAVRFKVEI
jgi:DNA ligase-1